MWLRSKSLWLQNIKFLNRIECDKDGNNKSAERNGDGIDPWEMHDMTHFLRVLYPPQLMFCIGCAQVLYHISHTQWRYYIEFGLITACCFCTFIWSAKMHSRYTPSKSELKCNANIHFSAAVSILFSAIKTFDQFMKCFYLCGSSK